MFQPVNESVLADLKSSGLVFELKHHRRFHSEKHRCNGFEIWLHGFNNECIAHCCSECGQEIPGE